MIILLYCMIASAVLAAETSQKFLYKAEDSITIEPHSTVGLTVELSTASGEYLGDSSIITTVNIQRAIETPAVYDILYFSYWLQDGQECYENWIEDRYIPDILPCKNLVEEQFDTLPICARYIDCSSEIINVTTTLQKNLFRFSKLMLENKSDQSVNLYSNLMLELLSDNGWFYWGVGLTCFLLISLVIFAGIVFYWLLKYKKVKKMFEQFKLTQQYIIKED